MLVILNLSSTFNPYFGGFYIRKNAKLFLGDFFRVLAGVKKMRFTLAKFLWQRFFNKPIYWIWLIGTISLIVPGFIVSDYLTFTMMGLTFLVVPALFMLLVYPSIFEFARQYRTYREVGFMVD